MSVERISEIKEQLFVLEKKIRPLEWDASRNQINEFKRIQLKTLQEEHSTLTEELTKLTQPQE